MRSQRYAMIVDDGKVTHVSTPAEALAENAAKLGDLAPRA